MAVFPKVGADEASAQQGGRAKYALFAAADGGTATLGREGWNGVLRSCRLAGLFHPGDSGLDYAGMLAAAPASEAMNLPAGCVGPGANSSHRN